MNSNDFSADKYVREEIILGRENLFGFFVLTITGLIFGIPYYFLWYENLEAVFNTDADIQTRAIGIGVTVIVLIIGFIAHEVIHGVFYAIFCKNKFKSVKIGVVPKKGYAYCECKEILRTNQFAIGLLMPTIILGIIPSIASLFTGSFNLLLFGMIFTGAGGSDLLIFKKVAKNMNNTWFENAVSVSKWYLYKRA